MERLTLRFFGLEQRKRHIWWVPSIIDWIAGTTFCSGTSLDPCTRSSKTAARSATHAGERSLTRVSAQLAGGVFAIMSFDSEADMQEAWKTEKYRAAAKIRESIMRETAIGVHVASVDEVATII